MIAIIDYGMGNLRSVLKAVEAVGGDALATSAIKDLEKAEHIILPGVGAFPRAMENLHNLNLLKALKEQVKDNKKPFLGLCLGMQLLADKGVETKECAGLGFIPGEVIKLNSSDGSLRVPHVGWNNLICYDKSCALFRGMNENELDFYFVHSYYINTKTEGVVAAECEYGLRFPAAVHKDNIYGVQFHPEKSQRAGLKLLSNFIDL